MEDAVIFVTLTNQEITKTKIIQLKELIGTNKARQWTMQIRVLIET